MSYFESGRINQKLRTRDLLVSTAKDLLREGKSFTVADVASIARVSRSTAYKYFPTQAQLISQVVLQSVSSIETRDKLDGAFKEHSDPEARVDAIVAFSDNSVRSHAKEYREMLRLSLERNPEAAPHRSNFRVIWLKRALEGLQKDLSKQEFQRLTAALGLCVGIEPEIVLHDIYGLSADQAREVKLWAASALLKSALNGHKRGLRTPATKKGRTTKTTQTNK